MINKVILVGNIGADPEVKSLESGVKTARLRMATTERFYDKTTQETKETTEWHTVNVWRQLAEIVEKYVHKGSQVYVEGSLHTREWTDKEGQKRYSTEITANTIKFLGRRESDAPQQQKNASAPQPDEAPKASQPTTSAPTDDDMPY